MLAVALLVAACSSGDAAEDNDHGVLPIEDSEPPTDDGSEEPVPDPDDDADEEPDPEPEDVDPFAIPDDIDEAYIDLVMNELLAIQSAALRDILGSEPSGELARENASRIGAVTSGPHLIRVGEDYLEYSVGEDSRENFLPSEELGDIKWTTRRIVEAGTGCVVAIGFYDLAEVAVQPYQEDLFVMASLARAPEDSELVVAHNATPWRIHDLNLLWVDEVPIPEEDWDRVNYTATLETTCEEPELP